MTDRPGAGTPASDPVFDDERIEAAAAALAEAFGLGDDFTTSVSWPIDDGDVVLAAHFEGDYHGTLLLAANAEVCGRLQSDIGRLAAGFAKALEALGDASLTLGNVAESTERPPRVVEMRDKERTCALFGVVAVAKPPASDTGVNADAAPMTTPRGDAASASAAAALADAEFDARALDVLGNVEVMVTAELGRTTMCLRDVMGLLPGVVIEIGRSASKPIDMLVGGKVMGQGDVVVVDEQFGVRVTNVAALHGPTDPPT